MDAALAGLVGAYGECRSVSVWALPPAALVDGLELFDALERLVAAKKLALIREIDAQGIAVEEGATTTAATQPLSPT